ncbi:hypothetical protein [Pelagicoccus sp. SDUM812003]|uniref:hypothetical protein n=1 Tax=Pelagicoccus sp. SDUM812003 TaxID=3041267 RepID=UPI002810137E|nr:hypothetical protein [Pelagicoccus sp. SDUM812003]MDQ8204404.1 hypothetical protein [Pelagicoccus sp. SDUM812003]
MRNSTTLKSILNRQCVTLGLGNPLQDGLFDCRRETGIGTTTPTISFKPFERVYKIPSSSRGLTLQAS